MCEHKIDVQALFRLLKKFEKNIFLHFFRVKVPGQCRHNVDRAAGLGTVEWVAIILNVSRLDILDSNLSLF